MGLKAKHQKVANAQIDEDGAHIITVETYKELVKSFRDFLRNQRNVPNTRNGKPYTVFAVNAVQYVHHIMVVTTGLIEEGLLESDPNGFLAGNVTSFGKHNKVINDCLIPDAQQIIDKEHKERIKKAESKGETVSDIEKELTPTSLALIVSEAISDEDRVVNILTTSGRKWIFDKESYTLAYKKADGTVRQVKIAKKGSWRATIIDFFSKCIKYVKDVYKNISDRYVGIKQTIQFKWMLMKHERELKRNKSTSKKQAKNYSAQAS